MPELGAVYRSRPFKIRNADEFELDDLLDLFVAPMDGLVSPFEYENNIVKGQMGAGKTMYLRANFAYYLYSIVPSLMTGRDTTLPILIRLSDFQHLKAPDEIYRQIILAILDQLCELPQMLADAQRLANLHRGLRSLPEGTPLGPKQPLLQSILKLGADEYVERISTELGLGAGFQHEFFKAAVSYKKDTFLEVRGKENPGIADIFDAYRQLIGESSGNLLLLVDEAGALDRTFFSNSKSTSLFETLMNQLRTAPYIRTKVAVYPHSYSDVLTETRYGDAIFLTENVRDEDGYGRFRERALALIDRYIRVASNGTAVAVDVFDIREDPKALGDLLEQLIYASGGNARRLVRLLDQSMTEAFKENKGTGRVHPQHVDSSLMSHNNAVESNYPELDRVFLDSVATACRSRGTSRFQFPYKAPVLSKYVTRSEEHNLLNIVDHGAGRRGTVYAFDYAYCVAHDIPTHLVRGSEKIDKTRSLVTGTWATRVATISEELVSQAHIPKEEGLVSYFENNTGFVQSESGTDYYFVRDWVIESDRERKIAMGQKVRFYRATMDNEPYALMVELI